MSTGSRSEVQLENEHFRVTKWTVDPGGVIPMHRHDYEYVVVPIEPSTLTAVLPDGQELVTQQVPGESYTRPAGSEHRIENRASTGQIVFVEVEKLA